MCNVIRDMVGLGGTAVSLDPCPVVAAAAATKMLDFQVLLLLFCIQSSGVIQTTRKVVNESVEVSLTCGR